MTVRLATTGSWWTTETMPPMPRQHLFQNPRRDGRRDPPSASIGRRNSILLSTYDEPLLPAVITQKNVNTLTSRTKVREVLIHDNHLSRKDIEPCANFDISLVRTRQTTHRPDLPTSLVEGSLAIPWAGGNSNGKFRYSWAADLDSRSRNGTHLTLWRQHVAQRRQ